MRYELHSAIDDAIEQLRWLERRLAKHGWLQTLDGKMISSEKWRRRAQYTADNLEKAYEDELPRAPTTLSSHP